MSRHLCSLSAVLLFFATISRGQRITTIQLDGVQYFVSRMNPYSPELNYFLAYQYCRSLGLQLVSFETKEKADSITQYLSNAGFNKYDFWTSGNRMGTNMFLWMSTGLPFNATFNYMKQTEIEDPEGPVASNVPGSTSPQRTARESDESGASSACVTLKAPSFEWKIDNCMSIKDFICEQTRCYYYNYGSIPVSSAQGKYKTTTAATTSSSTENIDNNNISNLLSKILSSPMQSLTEPDRDLSDRHPVFLHKDIDLEQSTNGPYDNFNAHAEMQDDPSSGTEEQGGYISTIEPEKVTLVSSSGSST